MIASHLSLPAGPWTTVLDSLCAQFPAINRAQWLSRMQRGRVLDQQGVAIAPDRAYREGLRVRYFREVADEPHIPFQETLLHVDAHLVVADKPHFLPVMPAGAYVEHTLLTRLMRRLDNPYLVPLHRIDRLTAGLVLFSANAASRGRYQALFREQRIGKTYEALAPPLPGLQFPFTRCSRLVAGEPFFRMQEIEGDPNSETHIEVLDRSGASWRYRLTPVTGRKHQLRVHLAALGAAIVNDDFYPALEPRSGGYEYPLKLLAKSLAFTDPISGESQRFESRLAL